MFTPPARKSMSDIELQNALGAAQADEAGVLGAMELLERQSALREEDDRAFAEWAQRLSELATPEAMHAIENGRRLIAGLEPLEFEQPAVSSEAQPESALETRPEAPNDVQSEPQSEQVIESDRPHQIHSPEFESHDAAHAESISNSTANSTGPNSSGLIAYDDEIAASLSALYAPSEPAQQSQSADSHSPEAQESSDSAITLESEAELEIEHESEVEPRVEHESAVEPRVEVESEAESDTDFEIVSETIGKAEPEFDQILKTPVAAQVANQTSLAESGNNEASTKAPKLDLSQLAPWFSISNVGFAVLLAFGVHLVAADALSGLLGLFVGILAANLPIAAAVVAAKRSGRDALFVSRAAFGVIGSQIPGWVFIFSRVIAIASAFAVVVNVLNQKSQASNSGLISSPLILVSAIAIASLGFAFSLNSKLRNAVTSLGGAISLLLAVAIAACFAPLFSFSNIDFTKSQNSNLIEIAALVFALIVSLWLPSAADFASTLGKSTRAISALAATCIGSFVAPLLLSAFFYLAFAGAGTTWLSQLDSGLLTTMSDVSSLAFWLLTFALVLSSLLWATNSIDSIRGMLSSMIAKVPTRLTSALVTIALLTATLALLAFLPSSNYSEALLGIFKIAAIPALGWAGIFTTDVVLRRVAYHEVSLSRSYGFYKPANITNLIGWLLSIATGFALLMPSSSIFKDFEFLGFARYFAPGLAEAVSASGAVFFIVFALSAVFPIAFGIMRIKEQEREALALEARRDDLKDIFKFGE